jgi:hypothetical protein
MSYNLPIEKTQSFSKAAILSTTLTITFDAQVAFKYAW